MYRSVGYNLMCQVNYVSAEMTNPERDLPRVIHTAVPLVTGFLSFKFSDYSFSRYCQYWVSRSVAGNDR